MQIGQIPVISDIKTYLVAILPEGISIEALITFGFYGRSGHALFNPHIFSHSPLTSSSLFLTHKEKGRLQSTQESLVYYNHYEYDDLYYWVTNTLPEATEEVLEHRLKHPTIVLSKVTQLLVQKYREVNGKEKTKKLLQDHSCVTWTRFHHPLKKWNAIYKNQPELNTNALADNPFSYYVEKAIRQQQNIREAQQRAEEERQLRATKETFLLTHSSKATATFSFKYGKQPAYKTAMGVELELDNLTAAAIPTLVSLLGKHAIFKRDGSVSNGVEICTAPATLDIHKEYFEKFFKEQKTTLEVKDNCGMHVHVDRKTLKQTQLAKILMFMNHTKNNSFIEKIAGRKANSYCQKEEHTWGTVINKTTGDKYRRVNLAPRETIEFRLFASTLNFKQFSRCLEFVQAVLDYTSSGEHNCSIKEVVKQEHFTTYVQGHRQFYPELYKFLSPKPTTGVSA